MCFDKGGRELRPPVGTVPRAVLSGQVLCVDGSDGEQTRHFANFIWVLLLEGGNVFLGVGDGFNGFSGVVNAQELDVLLTAEEEFEVGLDIKRGRVSMVQI